MSKINKVKNLKSMVSNLDINKLYKLQNYVNVSSAFFNKLEIYIIDYGASLNNDSEYEFTQKVINLYNSFLNDLKIK